MPYEVTAAFGADRSEKRACFLAALLIEEASVQWEPKSLLDAYHSLVSPVALRDPFLLQRWSNISGEVHARWSIILRMTWSSGDLEKAVDCRAIVRHISKASFIVTELHLSANLPSNTDA